MTTRRCTLLAVLGMMVLSILPLAVHMEIAAGGTSDNHEMHHDAGTPASDRSYSLFMHHVAGIVVLALSVLVFADRLWGENARLIGAGIGLVWISLGIFLFVNADPEGWPIGPISFKESFSMPTASEWLQHKLLSLIPALIGLRVWTAKSPRNTWSGVWAYLFVLISILGAVGLLWHQHASHPGVDLVNVQHRLFAVTAVFIAIAIGLDRGTHFSWEYKRFLLPAGLFILGIQLVLFRE